MGDALSTTCGAPRTNGLDPNRDASYQTNPEVRTVIQMINKWNPIALYDLQRFCQRILNRTCNATTWSELRIRSSVRPGARKCPSYGTGRSANSKYNSYIIPKLDWGDGWDDSFSGYTGVYAVYHGILGHTIEIPEGNQESYKAGHNAVLGGIDPQPRSDRLLEMRLNFYLRGLNKTEDPKAENELVGPNGEIVGRVKTVVQNSSQTTTSSQWASTRTTMPKKPSIWSTTSNAMVSSSRNSKKILATIKRDLVIDMAQAKRGYANHILYKGSNESAWAAMYAELLVNFPDMRGFKSEPVFAGWSFQRKSGRSHHHPRHSYLWDRSKAPYYVIANTSASAVKAVNQAIAQGKSVYLTDDGYIVDRDTLLRSYQTMPFMVMPSTRCQADQPWNRWRSTLQTTTIIGLE